MAFESNFVTMIGNLTEDPELRYTGNGAAVAKLRIAVNRRWTDREGGQQEETTFVSVNAWRELGENVAETLKKGDRALVIGRLRIRSYEDRDNQTRWVTEIEADEIAPSLRWARGKIEKTNRGQGSPVGARSNAGGNGGGGGGGGFPDGVPPTPDIDDVPF